MLRYMIDNDIIRNTCVPRNEVRRVTRNYISGRGAKMAIAKAKTISEYRDNIQNGIWFMLHTTAEGATTRPLMEAYAYNFRNVCNRMGCTCETHCVEMLEQNPPEKYFHIMDENGVPIGCLYHSIDCHNIVNRRLGKPEVRRSDAVAVYRPLVFSACTNKATESKVKVHVEKGGRKGGLTLEALATKYPTLIQRGTSHPRTFSFI